MVFLTIYSILILIFTLSTNRNLTINSIIYSILIPISSSSI